MVGLVLGIRRRLWRFGGVGVGCLGRGWEGGDEEDGEGEGCGEEELHGEFWVVRFVYGECFLKHVLKLKLKLRQMVS